MANGSSRLFPALIGLVLGFLLGWFIPHREAAPAPASAPAHAKLVGYAGIDHVIGVHGDGSLTKPEARIGRANKVAWASDGGESLEILFPESGFSKGVTEPPFAGMTHKGTDWAVRCGNGICFSGSVNPKLPERIELRYKYDQVVGTKRVDGLIIIEP
ncbi:MAG: hypothetical protein ACRD1B_00905 [Thermoanaerobaculia bacterium]